MPLAEPANRFCFPKAADDKAGLKHDTGPLIQNTQKQIGACYVCKSA